MELCGVFFISFVLSLRDGHQLPHKPRPTLGGAVGGAAFLPYLLPVPGS